MISLPKSSWTPCDRRYCIHEVGALSRWQLVAYHGIEVTDEQMHAEQTGRLKPLSAVSEIYWHRQKLGPMTIITKGATDAH